MSQSPVSDPLGKALENLQKLRQEGVDPALFWRLYLEALAVLSGANAGLVGVRSQKEGAAWQPVLFHPESVRTGPFAQTLMSKLDEALAACAADGGALVPLESGVLAAVVLKTGVEGQTCVALLHIARAEGPQAADALKTLRLVSDVPAQYQLARNGKEAAARQEQFAGVLDLMALLNARETFLAAGMTFVNELASRHRAERVSVGWLKDDGYVRLAAMSHVDDFEKKTEIVEKLELAMEEAYDQDADIVVPAPKDGRLISRDHEAFARGQEAGHVVSFPLRVDGRPVGVCTVERAASAFNETELRLLRMTLDQAARRLDDLKRRDLWIGARLKERWRPKLEEYLGPRHAWAKAIAIAGSAALFFTLFIPVPYRLQSTAILRTENVNYLTAPFDGHIEEVMVKPGESVKAGQELMRLDQNDLQLEEAGLVAEQNRYRREGEKARATNALADMRIADALLDQATAKLEITRYKLSQAVIHAPYDSVIVEGDLKERVGSPVKQGDVLFKVGRADKVYAELEVAESEIHHVEAGQKGRIALASRPGDTFKIRVIRVEPSAVPKKDGNVFLVPCEFTAGIPGWWRPGMTGAAKVRAGWHTLFWIFTHRTLDFLRLKFWF